MCSRSEIMCCFFRTVVILLGCFTCNLLCCAVDANDNARGSFNDGQKVYSAQCASCHGSEGQGNPDHFEDALIGDLSIEELAEYISETMPEEDPDQCVGEDAKAVAEYVYREFYSADAQLRRQPARIELSRRTNRQYYEAVADLISSYDNGMWIAEERGLEAHYFGEGRWAESRRLAKQIDPGINFPEGVPYFRADGKYEGLKKIKKDNKMGDGFSIYWRGSLIAPETGTYEFIVHCKNGFKLWINDPETPLIDQWVRTYGELTHRASVKLLGGRPYDFKLDLFSFSDPDVKIHVEWVPPSGKRSVIPEEAFLQYAQPESIVINTVFPPDDSSAGYARGTTISEQWDRATTEAAVEAANWIANRLWRLARTKENAGDRLKKVKRFCHEFVQRAFVSQLSEEEKKFFVDQHFDNELSITDQVKRVVILTLKSPRFLYPAVPTRDKHFRRAERMAMVMFDSVPGKGLLKKAAKKELYNDGVFMGEIYRMVNDYRSRQKLKNFFHSWLKTHHAADATKDETAFPEFNQELLQDLQHSLDMYLDQVAWSDESDFRELFLADYLYANRAIAKFYGLQLPEEELGENEFVKVSVDKGQRSGVLTHPLMMTGLAYHKDSSPVHRGVFVARSLLGRRLRRPPDDVEPLTEAFNPKMTTRERVEHQTKDAACMNCHSVINPLGFSLENFDAVGRFRTEEKSKPINVLTRYQQPGGNVVEFTGARDLATFLAEDEAAQKNFIRQLFRYYAKQSVHAYGNNQLDELHSRFKNNGFKIRDLIADITMVVVKHDSETDQK